MFARRVQRMSGTAAGSVPCQRAVRTTTEHGRIESAAQRRASLRITSML